MFSLCDCIVFCVNRQSNLYRVIFLLPLINVIITCINPMHPWADDMVPSSLQYMPRPSFIMKWKEET